MRAPTPARFCFCVCVCACVCAACALGRARLRVCVCRLYMFYCYCARVCEVCRVVVPVRNFWKIPVAFGASTRRRRSRFRVSRFRFSHFFFFFFRALDCGEIFGRSGLFRLWFVLIIWNFVLFVCRPNAVGGPSDPSTLNILIIIISITRSAPVSITDKWDIARQQRSFSFLRRETFYAACTGLRNGQCTRILCLHSSELTKWYRGG